MFNLQSVLYSVGTHGNGINHSLKNSELYTKCCYSTNIYGILPLLMENELWMGLSTHGFCLVSLECLQSGIPVIVKLW